MQDQNYDAIILGGGPAGLTAGIYLSRAKLKTLILDQGIIGGQMVLSYEIANYPGVEKTTGFQLSNTMKKQAISFGCQIQSNVKITSIDFESETKKIEVNGNTTFHSKAIIIATGGKSRSLNIDGEDTFKGKGISYCATCDGDFFQDKKIIVVGGGNTALEEAVSLTKYAKKVSIVHQFDNFQALEHAVEEAEKNEKIEFVLESRITEFKGDDSLKSVMIENINTKEVREKSIDGVFIFIGYEANTNFLNNKCIKLNQWNEIEVNKNLQTNIEGVFAAGDACQKRYRQITTAVSDGTISALNTAEYILSKKGKLAESV